MQKSDHITRKDDHIDINLNHDVQSLRPNGFEKYFFEHIALPEINFTSINTNQELFGKSLGYPFLISSMTGGVKKADKINRNLAYAAHKYKIAMGVGSQRPMLEDQKWSTSFDIRKYAPDILLFSNIGAVQLNYDVQINDLQHLVESIDADGLILHLNSLQEVFQPEGQLNFEHLLPKIETVVRGLQVPVIIKEVGWGISGRLAKQLENVGVAAIDVAGSGGTSWSQIEKYRQDNPILFAAAESFRDWGIPTAECLRDVAENTDNVKIFSSGGLKNGVEAAKSIAMGAVLCGYAGHLLRAATESTDEVEKVIDQLIIELKITMFSVGASNLNELSQVPIEKK
jgi:isopentenyl-diphosphate delta-isomerase